MKKQMTILSLLTLSLIAGSAGAEEIQVLECEGHIPSAFVELMITKENGIPKKLEMSFTNLGLNEEYLGTLNVEGFDPGEQDLVAKGDLSPAADPLSVVLQGSLVPSEKDGKIRLSVSAGWDHRVEYGYGNHLTCSEI